MLTTVNRAKKITLVVSDLGWIGDLYCWLEPWTLREWLSRIESNEITMAMMKCQSKSPRADLADWWG